ncbi:hypothetical protein NM688_g5518 [Phlebia brevispora]|uniref:Uncharacterized protein n=1 Tax=Phlebia brevispora TaxID=194682 RepID=A0ACC1SU26_9APHY|nr:hypothetical protein NM688_g5518 [Phlebia brevispora]
MHRHHHSAGHPRRPVRRPFSSPASQGYTLPAIRTQGVGRTPLTPVQLTSPHAVVTPTSAGSSTFSLSAFPAPPQSNPVWRSAAPQSPIRQNGPKMSLPTDPHQEDDQNYTNGPSIAVSAPDDLPQPGVPQICLPGSDDSDFVQGPSIVVGNPGIAAPNIPGFDSKMYHQLRPVVEVDDYPPCLGCGALIIGDAVNAMNGRWHPRCYRCCVCHESLEMLAPIEHEGRLYCTLDYHEKFSPRCYHCNTVIVDPTYITLNDREMGTRTYHDQHFFCSECGDPFVTPGMKVRTFEGDGPFEGAEVGAAFTVFHGFPYCSKCHARLRWPKCKKCKKSMAPDSDIIEALGAKWCSDCFVCTGCQSPFRNGRLFMRENKPFCQDCFEIIIKSEM